MSIADVLSIQLYTMRSLGDLDRILDAVADAGYRHVETVNSHLDDAAMTRAKLDTRGWRSSRSMKSMRSSYACISAPCSRTRWFARERPRLSVRIH
jgi:hypothetical protein